MKPPEREVAAACAEMGRKKWDFAFSHLDIEQTNSHFALQIKSLELPEGGGCSNCIPVN